MKKVILFNPPGGLWMRGEVRCEQSIDELALWAAPAPTTMAMLAAIWREQGMEPRMLDCPVAGIDQGQLEDILAKEQPDMVLLNASAINLAGDVQVFRRLKEISPNTLAAVNAPTLTALDPEEIPYDLYSLVDVFIVDDMMTVSQDLGLCVRDDTPMGEVQGIFYNDRAAKKFVRTPKAAFWADLDALPLPARDLLDNQRYTRPDTGTPLASIIDGRGCPFHCIYCLSQVTTGRTPRKRSVRSVVDEIKQCVNEYGIRDFMFRSDTFTIFPEWVHEFCETIITEKLDISWAANSRVNTFDVEMGKAMKAAGCFLVEFGIESGSDRSLKLQKKGTTLAQIKQAVADARAAKLLIYGTLVLGLPWETREDVMETLDLALRLKVDFIDITIMQPWREPSCMTWPKRKGCWTRPMPRASCCRRSRAPSTFRLPISTNCAPTCSRSSTSGRATSCPGSRTFAPGGSSRAT